jgi:hypothetical protein
MGTEALTAVVSVEVWGGTVTEQRSPKALFASMAFPCRCKEMSCVVGPVLVTLVVTVRCSPA